MLRRNLVAAAAALCLTLASAVPALADTTIRVMTWNATHTAGNAWWDKLTSDFEKSHPGIKIEGDFVTIGQYLTSLSAMTAGNSLPDLFWGNVKTLDLGKAGLALDLSTIFDKTFLDQFYPSTLRLFSDGKAVYGVPENAQMFGLFTNDRLLKQLGIDYPETWDQLIADAPKIRAAGLTPIAFGNLAKNVCPDFFLPLIAQYGGDVYALDAHTAKDVSWNSKPVVDALTLMQRLQQAHVFLDGVNGIDEQPAWQIAYQGKALTLFTNTSSPATFDAQGTKDWLANYSARKLPAVKADDIHYAGDGSGRAWVVSAKGANKAVVIDFLKFMFESDRYKQFVVQNKDFPSMPSALGSVSNPKVAEMAKWLQTDGADHILFGVGSWDAVSNACQGILDGSVQPAEAAAQIEDDVKTARAQAGQ